MVLGKRGIVARLTVSTTPAGLWGLLFTCKKQAEQGVRGFSREVARARPRVGRIARTERFWRGSAAEAAATVAPMGAVGGLR